MLERHAFLGGQALMHNFFDGSCSDVWCCGVMLYIMVTGATPPVQSGPGVASCAEPPTALRHLERSDLPCGLPTLAALISAC